MKMSKQVNKHSKPKGMKIKYISSFVCAMLIIVGQLHAQTAKVKKVLVIGVDGLISTAIDYASTPSIDLLQANGSYSMNGYGGFPAYANAGWSTMLTGVSATKHGATTKGAFTGNKFEQYPSMVKRLRTISPATVVGSVTRLADINTFLNADAQHKFNYASDAEVFAKSKELLGLAAMDLVFTQFSQLREVGEQNGYQLRDAKYVLAVQQLDTYVGGLVKAIKERPTYANENWAIFFVSSHGGTESGLQQNNSVEELNVPIIFSGDDLDKKELKAEMMAPKENGDNVLQINKSTTGEFTFARVPIQGTALQGMNKYTIEMWIKAGQNSSDPAIMADKDWDSGGNPGFAISRTGSSWKVNFANTKRERYDLNANKTLEDGNWHHIAVTFDKTKECIIYQDGVQVNRATLTYKPDDNMASPFNFLSFAQDATGKYDGGLPNWAGSFNEVRIWGDVLSAETIKNYRYMTNVEQGNHPNRASLNLYYKMDELRGDQIKDASGKGYHGQLMGSAAERHPYYPIGLTDLAVNVMSHLGVKVDGNWGLDGASLKSNVPFRLFKVK